MQRLTMKFIKPEINEKDIMKHGNTIECIKHMKIEKINEIYSSLSRTIEYIDICNLINLEDRNIIHIKSIKFTDQDEETIVLQSFYKSTGRSRGDSNISDIWFPCKKLEYSFRNTEMVLRITKLEDDILLKLTAPTLNYSIINEYENSVVKYCRFVNELNSYISKVLYDLNSNIEFNTYIYDVETFTRESKISPVEIYDMYENKILYCNPKRFYINL
jgi:hypothetical protein